MLPLRHTKRWQVGGILLLVIVLAVAMAPDIWPWDKGPKMPLLLSDKAMHALCFAFLTVWFSGQYARSAYPRLAVGLLAFGALIELCQLATTYRDAEWGDLAADGVGIVSGLAIALMAAGGWSLRMERWLANRVG